MNLEKILNPWVLLSLNLAIILVTELSGDLFMTTGAIHFMALLFVLLGISRIFVHHDVYDAYLRPLIWGGVAALIIFSLSHLVELVGFVYFKDYVDTVYLSVINFYLMSMLIVTLGAEYFIRALRKNLIPVIGIIFAIIPVLVALTAVMLFNKIPVSLDTDGYLIYIYGILVIGTLYMSVHHLVKIRRLVPIMREFVNYFIAAFVLIGISALQYVFYDALLAVGVPTIQVVYVSHFLFYGALSFIFLAFARLTNLGGIYNDIEQFKKLHPNL